jgi:hypothetical protein
VGLLVGCRWLQYYSEVASGSIFVETLRMGTRKAGRLSNRQQPILNLQYNAIHYAKSSTKTTLAATGTKEGTDHGVDLSILKSIKLQE